MPPQRLRDPTQPSLRELTGHLTLRGRGAGGATVFEQRVAAIVRRIPRGQVASYAMVADRLGAPGAARAVGGALAQGLRVPAHRVVSAEGRLVARWPEQAALLQREGVRVRAGHLARPIPWWRPRS